MMHPSRQRAPFPARASYINLNDAPSNEFTKENGYPFGAGGGPDGAGVEQNGHLGGSGSGTGLPPIWGLTREASRNGRHDMPLSGVGIDSATTHARSYRDPRGTPDFQPSNVIPGIPDTSIPQRRQTQRIGGPGYRPPPVSTASGSSSTTMASLLSNLPFPLPSPSTIKFILLCTLWYSSSALSSNTGKVILNNFRFPVTLTIVQFFFVAGYCWLTSRRWMTWLTRNARTRLRKPTKKILVGTLPMAVFQVGGHIFSSMAISRVPVSTVHTIKALSPLFTVCAYAFLFGVSYSFATYLSLLPLTLGVMLACSFDMSASNAFGLVCAFGSTLVFVSSNIVFKKLMPSHPGGGSGSSGATSAGEGRLDKINLLYYSSGMAFLLMVPIWLSSDVSTLLSMWLNPAANTTAPIRVGSASTLSVLVYFFLNGTVHFAQNYLAFAILSSTSPVTYSIASLVKRIAVICLAILWFNQAVHPVQAVGIALTGIGLYMYNNAKRDVERGEKKIRHMEAVKEGMLPMTKADQRLLDSSREGSPDVESVGGKGGPHASPRPTYLDISSVSVSSAVKSNGFSLPSPAFPLATSNGTLASVLGGVGGHPAGSGPQPQVTMSMSISEPYPSPPPSNASSPPFSSISVPSAVGTEYPATPYNPSSKPTRRRLSNENSHVKPDSMVSKPAAAQALHQHLPNVPSSPAAS